MSTTYEALKAAFLDLPCFILAFVLGRYLPSVIELLPTQIG